MDALPVIPVPDLGDLEQRLDEFWSDAAEDGGVTVRACALNIVLVCDRRDAVAAATRAVATLSEVHPARAFVVLTGGEGTGHRDRLRAEVAFHCHRGPGGARVCSEQINLEASGAGLDRLPETLLQLMVADCPVYTLWWERTPGEDPLWVPLAGISDRFVVDSAAFDDPAAGLGAVARLIDDRSRRVGDLEWDRLTPWRELLASVFDAATTAGYLERITGVEVVAGQRPVPDGPGVAARYLVGWLASRLGWRPRGTGLAERRDGREVALRAGIDREAAPGEPVTVRIECADADQPATFVAQRVSPDGPAVRLRMETAGACPLPITRRLQTTGLAGLLRRELERRGRDPVFREALAVALKM